MLEDDDENRLRTPPVRNGGLEKWEGEVLNSCLAAGEACDCMGVLVSPPAAPHCMPRSDDLYSVPGCPGSGDIVSSFSDDDDEEDGDDDDDDDGSTLPPTN